ncbi:hypothetical protein GALMADRAFT_145980 [Galerina marginata CBS 339.88]|uniref:Uncharacterized protein n=1 Tax=Galerina marginata (strain CBS 339.88) TaxID=685588 RepID=A0A067SDH8_GALM3|nr:hypothetical protein GALMADRAFT_145980 [Galerina marginata CBS 339.88]
MSKPWTRPPFPFQNISRSEHHADPIPFRFPDRIPSVAPQTPQDILRCSRCLRLKIIKWEKEKGKSIHLSMFLLLRRHSNWLRDPGYQGDTELPRKFVDPRQGQKQTPIARKVKSYQQKLLHSVIRSYLISKGLLSQSDDNDNDVNDKVADAAVSSIPNLPPSPDPAVIEAYLAFQHKGPNIENILIHWRAPMTHLWNMKAIQLLVNGFEIHVQDKQLVKLVELLGAKVTCGDIGKQLDEICAVQELIEHKLTARRSALRSVLKKVDVMTTTMNVTEISSVLQEKKQEGKCRSRRKERKKLKFLRRDDTIEKAILLPKNYENADNVKKWNDIKIFFSHFGVCDMSTDESETEGTFSKAKTLRRVRKYWLHPAASNVLHYVDSQYSPRKISGALKRGSAPLVRIHLAKKVNRTDTPTPEMPLNFYGPDISSAALEVLAPGPAIFIPIFPDIQEQQGDQEVANVTVLLDDFERLLENSRLELGELEQISTAIGLNSPGYASGLELLREKLFSQIDYFLDTTQMTLELSEIANCLDAAAFHPGYPPPDTFSYFMFQCVYFYGFMIVRNRVGGYQPYLTALDEELKILWTRVQDQMQNEGY